MLEIDFAAEVLEVGVIDPALAHRLIGKVMHMLEDVQAHHHARRHAGSAGLGIMGTVSRIEPHPVDPMRQPHQRVLHVDDVLEPCPEQVVRSVTTTSLRAHPIPPRLSSPDRESHLSTGRNPKRANCSLSSPKSPKPCNIDYFANTKTPNRSIGWAFFTWD